MRHGQRRRLPDRLHLRARPASRRAPCTSTATCWRSATATAATCCARMRDDRFMRLAAARLHLRARRPGAVSAARRRRRRSCWNARRRTTCSRPSRSSARRSASPRRPPIARCWPSSASTTFHRCANASPPARPCRRPRSMPGTRRPGSRSSTASARPRCCTSSSARPSDEIRAGRHRQAGARL